MAKNMLERYQESIKPHVAEARQIPKLATNFVDVQNEYQDGWTNFQKHGDPTSFTDKALTYYKQELKQIVIPSNFLPTEQGVGLNRWTPDTPYNVPGAAGF